MMSDDRLKIRINEIGVNLCSDYPDIKNQDEYGSLWAIEQTLIGAGLANDDLHGIIEQLKKDKAELATVLNEIILFLPHYFNDPSNSFDIKQIDRYRALVNKHKED